MSLKQLFFVGLIAISSIEVHHILGKLEKRDLRDTEGSKPSEEDTVIIEKVVTEPPRGSVWDNFDKYRALENLLTSSDLADNNITVIGWQRIWDDEGKIKEIRTIQLVISPNPKNRTNGLSNALKDVEPENEDDYKILPHRQIKKIRNFTEKTSAVGLRGSGTFEKFNPEREQEVLLFVDENQMCFTSGDFSIYNNTVVATSEELSDFTPNLKDGALGNFTSVQYIDGKPISPLRCTRPHILDRVHDHYEATDDILFASPLIMAEASLLFTQEEFPKELAQHYDRLFDDFKWRVLVDASNTYVTRDVSVTLTHDNYDFYESDNTEYFVYGVNKTNIP